MAESIEVFRYISYLRERWQWIASSCGIALVLASMLFRSAERAQLAASALSVAVVLVVYWWRRRRA